MWTLPCTFHVERLNFIQIFSDRDGDEMLTEEEFAVLQVSGGETLVSQGEVRRRTEFRNVIDTDNNALADRHELLVSRKQLLITILFFI